MAGLPNGRGVQIGLRSRSVGALVGLRISTGNFINGKEKPLHLFVECRDSVGGFQAWPVAGRCALLGNATPWAGQVQVMARRKTATRSVGR